ncbi:putative long-chain-alcohol O-fatty-acyltransferase 5 [Carex rostrata]
MDEAMEALRSDLKTLPKLITTVVILVSYARFTSSLLRPGLPRFLSLLPVVSLLPFLPFTFSTIHLRGLSGFLLVWLCITKLLLLSFGCGPLDPSLPLIRFISLSTLPVKLQDHNPHSKSFTAFSPKLLISTAIRAAILAALVSMYRFQEINYYVLLLVYCVYIYLSLELVLSTFAIITSQALGMELEPQFNKPYFTTSLRDFWGRRWNLMVSAILRPSIYEPVKIYFGPKAGVFAVFLTSGLMHELMFYYSTLRKPTGEVTAFFMLHGICVLVEWWWAKYQKWWCPPRAVATLLTLGFVVVTAFWLFFPPLVRGGSDEKMLAEVAAMVALIKDTGQWVIGTGNWDTKHIT